MLRSENSYERGAERSCVRATRLRRHGMGIPAERVREGTLAFAKHGGDT